MSTWQNVRSGWHFSLNGAFGENPLHLHKPSFPNKKAPREDFPLSVVRSPFLFRNPAPTAAQTKLARSAAVPAARHRGHDARRGDPTLGARRAERPHGPEGHADSATR